MSKQDKKKLIDEMLEKQIDPMTLKKERQYKENDPAFIFYPNDFLGLVADLNDYEVGQFIKLMCYQFQQGHLSEKIISLKFNGTLSDDVKSKLSKDGSDNLYLPYLDRRIFERMHYVTSRQENGKKNKHKQGQMKEHMVKLLENEDETESKNLNVDKVINEGYPQGGNHVCKKNY